MERPGGTNRRHPLDLGAAHGRFRQGRSKWVIP